MQRFSEIEGLRAWLAWTVVLSHLFVVLNIQTHGADMVAPIAGADAVEVFVLISGFVITGLILDRHEPWARFIVRRAFRIFPAYLIALFAGAVTMPLAFSALSHAQWGVDPTSYFYASLHGQLASLSRWPGAHWLLHLSLMQSAIPDNVLPWSSVAFVGPAWSLSLEWQFYLLAPAIIWAMRSKWATALVVLALLLAVLFQRGVFGSYNSYSSLIGGLWLFLIGIASRLALPRLQALKLPVAAIMLGALAVGVLFPALLLPFAIWISLLVFMVGSKPTGAVAKILHPLLQSRLATALGARSFSVYIIHIPIIEALLFLLPLRSLPRPEVLALLAPLTIALVLLVSEGLYRFVERPMIRAGARVAALRLPPALPAQSEHSA